MVLKSGKLVKHSHSIFGSKWKVTWVHLDETTLKYFPMVVNQQVFQGAKSKVLRLEDYTVSMIDEIQSHRKHCFQLVSKHKHKSKIFACSSDRECREWVEAITHPHASVSNQFDEERTHEEDTLQIKRAKGAFSQISIHLTVYMGWQGSSEEFAVIQQALDPQLIGKIPRVLFLSWARAHFSAPEPPPPAPTPAPVQATPLATDWNGLYWELLHNQSSGVSQGLSVAHLMKEFHLAATSLARSVIEEVLLHPASSSAVDPPSPQHINLGYMDCPMFPSNGLCAFIYLPATNLVTKTLGHDVRSARVFQVAVDAVGTDAITVPLQCLIDYLGVRVLVVADLASTEPFEMNRNGAVSSAIRQVLEYLHTCISDDSLDVTLPPETHVVKSNDRIIVTKLRHLCAPDVLQEHDDEAALCAWKLRPEYIRKYHTPLYSNAYRGNYGKSHDNVVACASHYLQKSIIPACVQRLESNPHLFDSGALTALMHREGINMRYIGRMYEMTNVKYVRRFLLTEMIARAAKVLFRAMIREGPAHSRAIAVDFFNVLCGASKESIEFYANEIEPTVDLKFGAHIKDCRQELHIPQLFVALQYHTGVYFVHSILYALGQIAHPFRASHIQSLEPSVTMLCSTTPKCQLTIDSIDSDDNEDLESKLQNAKLALAIEQACPTNVRHVHLCNLLVQAAELSLRLNNKGDAETFATLALEEGPSTHAVLARAHVVLMNLHHEHQDLQSLLESFEKAVEVVSWHLSATHPCMLDAYTTMADIWIQRSEWEKALDNLDLSTAVVKESYGRFTARFASIRCKQGGILKRMGDLEQALSMYEDALLVYENIPSTLKDRANCCSAMTDVLVEMKSFHTAYNMAMQAHELRKECSSEDLEGLLSSWMTLGRCSRLLDDDFRALECYKSALALAKAKQTSIQNVTEKIQEISRLVLALVFQTLFPEAKQCVEKIKLKGLDVTSELIAFVVAQINALDVTPYVEMIFSDLLGDDSSPSPPIFEHYSSELQLNGVLHLAAVPPDRA